VGKDKDTQEIVPRWNVTGSTTGLVRCTLHLNMLHVKVTASVLMICARYFLTKNNDELFI
jgi:hypothetical protein